jgi:hypothetical protein
MKADALVAGEFRPQFRANILGHLVGHLALAIDGAALIKVQMRWHRLSFLTDGFGLHFTRHLPIRFTRLASMATFSFPANLFLYVKLSMLPFNSISSPL